MNQEKSPGGGEIEAAQKWESEQRTRARQEEIKTALAILKDKYGKGKPVSFIELRNEMARLLNLKNSIKLNSLCGNYLAQTSLKELFREKGIPFLEDRSTETASGFTKQEILDWFTDFIKQHRHKPTKKEMEQAIKNNIIPSRKEIIQITGEPVTQISKRLMAQVDLREL